jgi:hypothetical protein
MATEVRESLTLEGQEVGMVEELLDEARTKLLVEIRHTDHRRFLDGLRQRLALVERLLERCRAVPLASQQERT